MLDTSALLAILFSEPERERFMLRTMEEQRSALPAPAYLEAALKLDREPAHELTGELDLLIEDLGLILMPFTAECARVSREAFRRFGRGRHALNFGDCMVYAVAKLADAPLLFKGEDFAQTDIRAAL